MEWASAKCGAGMKRNQHLVADRLDVAAEIGEAAHMALSGHS